MNAQQLAMMQSATMMQQQQMAMMQQQQAMAMQGAYAQQPYVQPQQPYAQPQQPYAQQPYSQPQQPYVPPTGNPTPGGPPASITVVNSRKAVKLPDGVSFIEIDLAEIKVRGPTGTTITMTTPPKPDCDKEENVKPTPFAKSRSGECKKLAFKKMFGKPKWNKRSIKLDGKILEWNAKHPKKVELKRGIKVSAAEANSPKRKDAHEDSLATMMTTPIGATFLGEVGKNYCVSVHVPADLFGNLSVALDLMNQSPMQMMAGANKISKDITHYFQFKEASERDSWLELIETNLEAAISQDYVPYKFFKDIAAQAGITNADKLDWRGIITALYAEN